MIQSGGNPQQLINQIVNQNPKFKNIMNNINGKDPNQLKDMFYSMCKEKGINPQDIAKQYNINLPKLFILSNFSLLSEIPPEIILILSSILYLL